MLISKPTKILLIENDQGDFLIDSHALDRAALAERRDINYETLEGVEALQDLAMDKPAERFDVIYLDVPLSMHDQREMLSLLLRGQFATDASLFLLTSSLEIVENPLVVDALPEKIYQRPDSLQDMIEIFRDSLRIAYVPISRQRTNGHD